MRLLTQSISCRSLSIGSDGGSLSMTVPLNFLNRTALVESPRPGSEIGCSICTSLPLGSFRLKPRAGQFSTSNSRVMVTPLDFRLAPTPCFHGFPGHVGLGFLHPEPGAFPVFKPSDRTSPPFSAEPGGETCEGR